MPFTGDEPGFDEAGEQAAGSAFAEAGHLLEFSPWRGAGQEEVVKRHDGLRADTFVMGGAKGDERMDAGFHAVEVEHPGHEADLVFADADEPGAPVVQFFFAKVAAAIEIALAGGVGGVEAGVVAVPLARQPAAGRPQSVAHGPQGAMGLQAAGAAIAVEERVYPGHALVGGGNGEQEVFQRWLAAIDLIETVEESRQRFGRRRFMAADGDQFEFAAQGAGGDKVLIGAQAIGFRQPAVERGVGFANEGAA